MALLRNQLVESVDHTPIATHYGERVSFPPHNNTWNSCTSISTRRSGGRPNNCCCRPCIIMEDDFVRDLPPIMSGVTTDLGIKWNETRFDSWIETDGVTGVLVIPSGGRVTTVRRHPVKSQTCLLVVELSEIIPESIYIISVNTNVTGEFGNDVTYTVGPTGAVPLLNTLEADDDIIDATYPTGENVPINICRNYDTIYADADQSATVWGPVQAGSGTYVTLANASEHNISFKSFSWLEHDITNSGCGACYCDCSGYGISKELTLTWSTPVPGDCDCMDGSTLPLTFISGDRALWLWGYSGISASWWCDEQEDYGYQFVFDCSDHSLCVSLPDSNLNWTEGCPTNYYDAGESSSLPTTFTCGPFTAVYPAIFLSISFPAECSIVWTIT